MSAPGSQMGPPCVPGSVGPAPPHCVHSWCGLPVGDTAKKIGDSMQEASGWMENADLDRDRGQDHSARWSDSLAGGTRCDREGRKQAGETPEVLPSDSRRKSATAHSLLCAHRPPLLGTDAHCPGRAALASLQQQGTSSDCCQARVTTCHLGRAGPESQLGG